MNSGGAVGAVLCPVGFRDEHTAADRTAFQVLIPENLRFQRLVQRQNRPAEPLTADRERNRLRTGAGVPIVKEHTVPVLITAALPADQGVCLFPLRWGHAVKGTVRPAFQRWQVFMGLSLMRSLHFSLLPFAPKRLPAPFLRRVPALARSPQLLDTCPEVTSGQSVQKSVSLRCFPGRGISFRTVIRFSRCCPSMNYPKSTPK